MNNTPLFILFIDSVLSTKIVSLIENGKINAIIYCSYRLLLKIKKIFSKKTIGKFQIFVLNLPFNITTFNLLFTSKNFWDNINSNNSNLYIVHNPKVLSLQINIKNSIKPFYISPLIPHKNSKQLIWENPSIFDEIISQGFLLYIKPKFAKKTIKYLSKNNILTIRKKFKMQNNEYIERLPFIPFYMYFYHNMIDLGYND